MQIREFLSKILPAGWLPYLLHLRPRAWPIVAAHMSVGFFLANGFHFTPDALRRGLLAILAWAVLGNGGTLAINSVFDKDEGDIGYLENPPPLPRHLLAVSLIFMLAGLPVAALLGYRFLIAYVICLVMSLLYSVPPFRLKARAGYDVLINSAGFGALTLYAGWAAMGRELEPTIVYVVAGFFFLFAGFYPLTQLYQMAEDMRRGDVTLAILLNRSGALRFAMLVVVVGFSLILIEAGIRFRELRSLGILLSLALWAILLASWYIRRNNVDMAFEQRGFYRALWVWAITDLSVVLAMAPV